MKLLKNEKIEIGQILQTTRKSLGMTQEQVAEKLDLAPRYISDIERNKTKGSLDTLVKLCNIYNVTPTFILQDYLKATEIEFDNNIIGYYNLSDYEKGIISNLIKYMNSQKNISDNSNNFNNNFENKK